MSTEILPKAPKAVHTPGPWRYDPMTGEVLAVRDSEGRSLRIARVSNIANGFICAAGPDLLAANVAFVAWMQNDAGCGDDSEAEAREKELYEAAFNGAQAAIAKAQGETR